MGTISIQDIERDPREFLHRVEAGESFVIVRDERPLAEVRSAAAPAVNLRPHGLCAGAFRTPADFDGPLPEDVLQEFDGS